MRVPWPMKTYRNLQETYRTIGNEDPWALPPVTALSGRTVRFCAFGVATAFTTWMSRGSLGRPRGQLHPPCLTIFTHVLRKHFVINQSKNDLTIIEKI